MKTMKIIGLILGIGLGIFLGSVAYFHFCLLVMKLAVWYWDYMGFHGLLMT